MIVVVVQQSDGQREMQVIAMLGSRWQKDYGRGALY